MVIECPSCFQRVIPLGDRCCPNCRKNVDETEPSAFGQTTLWVTTRSTFPSICHCCDTPTARRHKIVDWESRLEYDDGSGGILRWVAFLAMAAFFPFAILFPAEGRYKHGYKKIALRIPTCRSCSREDIRFVDVARNSRDLRIAVTPEFAEQYRRLSAHDV